MFETFYSPAVVLFINVKTRNNEHFFAVRKLKPNDSNKNKKKFYVKY